VGPRLFEPTMKLTLLVAPTSSKRSATSNRQAQRWASVSAVTVASLTARRRPRTSWERGRCGRAGTGCWVAILDSGNRGVTAPREWKGTGCARARDDCGRTDAGRPPGPSRRGAAGRSLVWGGGARPVEGVRESGARREHHVVFAVAPLGPGVDPGRYIGSGAVHRTVPPSPV